MIRIITIEREYGCGGGEIAQRLAELLGWKLWDQQLTCEIARRIQCDQSQIEKREERTDPLYYRLLKSFLRGSYEGSLNAPRLNLLDSDNIVRITEQVVQQALAAGNCVIVGRGSQHFLQDRDDTLRIFLYASPAKKTRRLVARGISEQEAADLVDTVDGERPAFIKKYFNVEWPNRSIYHAMINTAAGNEAVVRMIVNLMDVSQRVPLSQASRRR